MIRGSGNTTLWRFPYVTVWKTLPAMYPYNVLNQNLESLGELGEKAEQALEQQMPELEREEPEEGFGMSQQM